jgi:hypothetical protein
MLVVKLVGRDPESKRLHRGMQVGDSGGAFVMFDERDVCNHDLSSGSRSICGVATWLYVARQLD